MKAVFDQFRVPVFESSRWQVCRNRLGDDSSAKSFEPVLRLPEIFDFARRIQEIVISQAPGQCRKNPPRIGLGLRVGFSFRPWADSRKFFDRIHIYFYGFGSQIRIRNLRKIGR